MVERPWRLIAWGGVATLSAALAGCFNPPAKDSEGTGDPATGDPATGDPTTADPTVTDTNDATLATTPTTGEDPETSPTQPGCDCPPETPYCTVMGCGTCNDLGSSNMQCADFPGNTPFCDEASGMCVACTPDEGCLDPPFCHPETHVCVGCVSNDDCDDPANGHCEPGSDTCVPCNLDEDCSGFGPTATCDVLEHVCSSCAEHGDCPETACDLARGQCFPAEQTTHAYVDKIGCEVMMDSPVCAQDTPCCEIAQAFKDAVVGPQEHLVIHVSPGLYTSPVQVDADNKRIAILGADNVALMHGDPEAASLGLKGGVPLSTALFVSNVDVLGPTATVGVLCSKSTGGVWYDDSAVRDIGGPAVFASECVINVRRAELTDNSTGVQASAEGTISVENSVIVGSHGGFALHAISDGVLDLLYTSVLDLDAAENHLLSCDSLLLAVRNSLVLTEYPGGILPGCTVTSTRSAFAPGVMTIPMSDLTIDPVNFSSLFVDHINDDLHLKNMGSQVLTLALWQAGDPPTDRDGKSRPTTPESPDAAGAHLP
jgi:hypothetical protein